MHRLHVGCYIHLEDLQDHFRPGQKLAAHPTQGTPAGLFQVSLNFMWWTFSLPYWKATKATQASAKDTSKLILSCFNYAQVKTTFTIHTVDSILVLDSLEKIHMCINFLQLKVHSSSSTLHIFLTLPSKTELHNTAWRACHLYCYIRLVFLLHQCFIRQRGLLHGPDPKELKLPFRKLRMWQFVRHGGSGSIFRTPPPFLHGVSLVSAALKKKKRKWEGIILNLYESRVYETMRLAWLPRNILRCNRKRWGGWGFQAYKSTKEEQNNIISKAVAQSGRFT